MNKTLPFAMLAGLLSCAGCFTATPPDVAPAAAPTAAKALPPISPDQVTETNAHEVAQGLEQEINREQQMNMLNAESR